MTALNNTYSVSNVIRCSVAFTVSGVATDPTTVTLTVKDPTGTITTYTYAGSTVTKDSTGNYHKDVSVGTTPGTWYYAFVGTGTCAAEAEGKFFIKPSDVS